MDDDAVSSPQVSGPQVSDPRAAHPFSVLPEPVRLEDTVAGQDVTPARDPENGRDTETEFMLRHM